MQPIGSRAASLTIVFLCCVAAMIGWPCTSFAQSTEPPAGAEDGRSSRRAQPTRLYVGMWTLHLKEPQRQIANNWLIGISYRGYFGGTFLNSFGKRAYTAGFQRPIVSAGGGPTRAMIGYRVGAISGYDGRFTRLARKTPVLPIGSVFGIVEHRRVGIELSYTFIVASAALTYRF